MLTSPSPSSQVSVGSREGYKSGSQAVVKLLLEAQADLTLPFITGQCQI